MSVVSIALQKRSRERLLNGDVPQWVANSPRRRYVESVLLSTPPWVDRAHLTALVKAQVWESEMNGEQYVLDHIVPLNHPRVCGLTVPWNLKIIPKTVNDSKGNHWCPEQMDLFE